MDLDNDGVKDTATVQQTYILVSQVKNLNAPGSDEFQCTTSNRPKDVCDVIVTVKYKYRAKFFMARIFGLENFELKATRQMTITN